MQLIRRMLFGMVVASALILAGGPHSASADPVAGTNKVVFPVECGDQTYLVVGGTGAPAQIIDSQGVLIAATFVQTVSYVDPATGDLVTQVDVIDVGRGKRTGQQGDLITCAYTVTIEDPALGLVTIEGAVTAFVTPRAASR